MENNENSKQKQQSFRFKIYQVFDSLLESQRTGLVAFFIIHLIEFLQILLFLYNKIFSSYWTNQSIYNVVYSFLSNSWPDHIIFGGTTFINFEITLFIYFSINILILIDFTYMHICLKKNYEMWTLAKMFLQFIANIYMPVLFIPMLDCFISIFNCASVNGVIMNNIYTTEQCFTSGLILHIILSVFGVVTILIYGYFLSVLFYESNPGKKNVKSRFYCLYEKSLFITKILWVIVQQYSVFLPDTRDWICNVVNFFCSLINFILLVGPRPFFNVKAQKILLIFRNIEFFTSIVLTISMIISNYDGDFILFFIGSVLIIFIQLFYPDKKYDVIIISNENIRNEYILQKKLFAILDLVDNQDKLENELFIKGFVSTQNVDDKNSLICLKDGFVKHDLEHGSNGSKNNLGERKGHTGSILNNINEEEYTAFIKYIEDSYKKALVKFHTSNAIKLNYLLFTIRYLKNPSGSMVIVKKIMNGHLSFEEDFILYRYTRLVEEKLLLSSFQSQHVDINFEINYKKNRNNFLTLIESTTKYLIEFWDLISRDEMKISMLEGLIYKINVNLEQISEVWNLIQKMKQNDKKINLIYENFLQKVLNDEESGEDLKNTNIDCHNLDAFDKMIGDYIQYIEDGSGYILSSGSLNNMGRILSANTSVAVVFGYRLEELIQMSINSLMPEIYHEEHDERLLSFSYVGVRKQGVREFKRATGYGVNRSGYIFPVNLTMTILRGMNDTFNFLSFIRNPPSDILKSNPVFFVTDLNFYIRNVSSQAITLFGINNHNFFIKSQNEMEDHAYLNLAILIKDLHDVKDDPDQLKQFKPSSGSSKKRVRIKEIEDVKNFLRNSSEKNKAIKIEESDTIMKKLMNNLIEDVSPDGEKHYRDYFIAISDIVMNGRHLGYAVQLDPIKDEKRVLDYKYEIVFEENNLHFDPYKWEFKDTHVEDYSPRRISMLRPAGFNNFHLDDIAQNINNANNIEGNLSKYKKKKKKKSKKKGINRLKQIDFSEANTISAFLNECEIYDHSTEVVSKCINIGTRLFRVEDKSPMKVEQILKNIEDYFKYSPVKELDLLEEDKSEEQSFLEKSTEDLLNFKGIEGWQQIINKIKKNKVPKEIKILRIFSIFAVIVKFVLMIVFYVYLNNSYSYLSTINDIQNLTDFHAYYMIDSVIKGENYINYHLGFLTNETQYNIAKAEISDNINNIINITNSLRGYKEMSDTNFNFVNNYTYTLLNTGTVLQKADMNLVEIFMQLINKLFAFTDDSNSLSTILDEYIIYFKNTMNVYLKGIKNSLKGTHDTFLNYLSNIGSQLRLIMLLALSLIIFLFINTFYNLKIITLKQKSINLFFHIPQRVCWKYYAQCENFMKMIVTDEENEEEKDKNRNCSQKLGSDNENEEEFKNMLVTSNKSFKDKKSESKIFMLINVLALNFIYFFIDFSYYGVSYLTYKPLNSTISQVQQFKVDLNELNRALNIYLINQRQIYNNTGLDVDYEGNVEVQNQLYQNITAYIDTQIVDNMQGYVILKNEIDSLFSSVLINGLCNDTNTTYVSICQKIPAEFQGLNKMIKFYFESLTDIYLNYALSKEQGVQILKADNFLLLNEYLTEYISPIIIETYQNFYVTTIHTRISDVKLYLTITIIVYSLVIVIIFLLYSIIYQNRIVYDIVYSKTTLLLINPSDLKEIKSIMTFLKREVFRLKNTN